MAGCSSPFQTNFPSNTCPVPRSPSQQPLCQCHAFLCQPCIQLRRASNASKVAVLNVLISVSGQDKHLVSFLPYLIVPIVELHWSDRLTDLCGLFFSFFSIFARVQWHLVALIDTKNIHWDVCTCLSVSQRLCFYTIMTFSWLSSLVETWKTAPSGTWSLKCHSAGIDLSRVASSCSGVKGARTATGLRVLQV